jgi:hypothetical protein
MERRSAKPPHESTREVEDLYIARASTHRYTPGQNKTEGYPPEGRFGIARKRTFGPEAMADGAAAGSMHCGGRIVRPTDPAVMYA